MRGGSERASIGVMDTQVLIEAEVEFEAGFAAQAEIEAVDQAAGAPVKAQGPADETGAVVGVEADALEIHDLAARQRADGALEAVGDAP